MYDVEKRSPPDKKLQKAIKYLEEEYERAKTLDFVISPICYALYRTWKRFDEKEYQKNMGMESKTVSRYLHPDESRKSYKCPKMLEYQFTDDFKLKISSELPTT